ncbi:Heavy metal-associated domain, HMA [Dillenia turbinata]|uniref:Heavy metal-associated domain, HMA n=1 Tax=Dillenia turbinata TaxID=194707 RepID=A0AAN8W5M6_9MAGN
MKRLDFSCASQASTAICLSMDHNQPSSSTTIHLGGRAIDRHNPIIGDGRRFINATKALAPCTSQTLPINPKPYHQLNNNNNTKKKKKKISSDTSTSKSVKFVGADHQNGVEKTSQVYRRSFSGPSDLVLRNSRGNKFGELISPLDSSRYLLGENNAGSIDALSDFDPVSSLVPFKHSTTNKLLNPDDNLAVKQQSSSCSSSSSRSADQVIQMIRYSVPQPKVVVLRVSLHCKGCEGKVRKHISRMQGVTSFNIDFAAKKVTVVGDVTPLGVLASISKVKNAQLWTPSMPNSHPSTISSTTKNKAH